MGSMPSTRDKSIRRTSATMKTTPSADGIRWSPVSLDEARAARERTREITVRTPLVRFDYDTDAEIYLKLECLQPIRSFKLRGASNAILAAGRETLAEGVWTSSAGNMAQGVAYTARAIDVPAVVYMPDTAPQAKIDNVQRYGGEVRMLPVMEWAEVFRDRRNPGASGVYIHPYSDPLVMAGNAVIGLELLEDLPDVDAVVVPWGGGGLCMRDRVDDQGAQAGVQGLCLRGRYRGAAGGGVRGGRSWWMCRSRRVSWMGSARRS